LTHFDHVSWPQFRAGSAAAAAARTMRVDVAAKMRGMWR